MRGVNGLEEGRERVAEGERAQRLHCAKEGGERARERAHRRRQRHALLAAQPLHVQRDDQRLEDAGGEAAAAGGDGLVDACAWGG